MEGPPRCDSSKAGHRAKRGRDDVDDNKKKEGNSVPPRAQPYAAKATTPLPSLPPTTTTSRTLQFPYQANFNDHFETSVEALKDLLPVLDAYRSQVRPSCPESFALYDPYYCAGSVQQQWHALGIQKVIHEKRDFYKDIAESTVPAYDILVTNPPYSDDHIPRLLDFLIESKKAWAILVPDYIASKDWYLQRIERHFQPNLTTFRGQNIHSTLAQPGAIARQRVMPFISTFPIGSSSVAPPQATTSAATQTIPTATGPAEAVAAAGGVPSSASSSSIIGVEPFYVVPKVWYDFKHPVGAGNDKSHFKSVWIVWCGRRTNDVLRAVSSAAAAAQNCENAVAFVPGIAGLREGHHIRFEPRKNPQQRRKDYGSQGYNK